jgi:TonB-linked SusC/RagA family outer membrane protein
MLKPKTINTIIMMKIYQFKLRRRLMVPLLGMVLFITNPFIAQNLNITGTITSSEDGAPIPGCSIVVKGIQTGTISDFDGNFSIVMPSGSSILVFRYLGFESKEVSVASNTVLNIVLSPDAMALDEIVVIGYGTARKSDLTGSVSSVSSSDFEKQPLTKIDQALQGRSAGVQVTQSSGAPGSGFKIRVRGANSVSGDNTPLYVVDGLIVGSINSLNVNDINSMEVLKDASSTAIYGSRGANGVVLITTKNGKRNGPAKIGVDVFTGFSNVAQGLDYMTPAQFAEGVNFVEGSEFYSPSEIEALRNGGGEDWEERLFQTSYFTNAQLSISGGNEKIDYFISGNYFDSDGTIVDQDYRRYTLRANLNANISDKSKIGFNTFLSRERFRGVRANLADGLTWDPTTPAFDSNGNLNFVSLKPGVGNIASNPLLVPLNTTRNNFTDNLIISAYFNSQITKNLEFNISGGLDRLTTNNNSYTPIIVNTRGSASINNNEVTRLQNTNRLTYSLDKDPRHRFKLDVVHEQQLVTRKAYNLSASEFFSDQTTYNNLALGAIQNTSNNNNDESIQSVMGRANYSLLNKYLFTATVRTDGSSKFQKGNRWGVFPSASAAWRISEESFIQDIESISNLKLRTSFGETGSQAIDPLATLLRPQIDANQFSYAYDGGAYTVGVAPSNQQANPDLTWETTKQANIGLDLGLWNSALSLSIDWYHKTTNDLLLASVLPEFVGPTRQVRNIGSVENKGFDLSLNYKFIQNDNWNINSTLTVSSNRNKVLSLVDGLKSIELGNDDFYTGQPFQPTTVAVGRPISSFRGFIFDGVFQLGEESEAAQFGTVPGGAKYRDISGPEGIPDGLITDDDITIIGDGNPDFTWGWNWDISWKNFNLNLILLGSQGNDIYNFQRGRMLGLGSGQFHAVSAEFLNRWTPSNPSDIPSSRDGTELLSTQFVEDGSFVSLKNVALSYTITKDMLPKSFIDSLRLYVSAENLFVFTNYSGFDPESTASGNSDVDLGIDLNTYPLNRSFTFGMNLQF